MNLMMFPSPGVELRLELMGGFRVADGRARGAAVVERGVDLPVRARLLAGGTPASIPLQVPCGAMNPASTECVQEDHDYKD